MRVVKISLIVIVVLLFFGCGKEINTEEPHLLIYCGITMVKPIREISSVFEKEHKCKITIAQGGSEDLYQSLKTSQIGDLYLPGSDIYRTKHISEGFLLNYVEVGYNQLAFFVQKGNPFHIKGNLAELTDQRYIVLLGNPETCSVGKSSEKVLKKANLFDKVFKGCTGIASDSRDINKYLLRKQADLALNWKATAFFNENKKFIDVVELEGANASTKRLLLMRLKFTKYPKLVNAYMKFAKSDSSQKIFKKYGFIE